MLRNLLENANRYSNGSDVEADITPDQHGRALCSVEDRGPGIPENERERVFEPFYRARRTRETGEVHTVRAGNGAAIQLQIIRGVHGKCSG